MKIYEVIAEDAAYNVGFAAGKVTKLIDQYIVAHKIQGEVVTSTLGKTAGTFLRVIKMLGYYDIALQLVQQSIAIKGLVAAKQITAEEGVAAYRQQCEKMVAAVIAAGVVTKLMSLLKILPFIKWFVRAGAVVATGASLGTLGGPSIMLAIATEVGIIWLQKYLATKEGQEVLAWWAIYIIDPSVVWLWNESFGRIVEAWKIDPLSKEAQAKVDGTIKGKDAAASGIAGKPSADAKKDIDSSSTSKFLSGPEAQPYDQYGNKTGWGVGDRYARKIGDKMDQGEDYRGPKPAALAAK
jgi:hypothetical protein